MKQPAFADTDHLFRHVADENIQGAKILAAACTVKQFNEGLSVNWSRFSTPADTVRGTPRTKVIAIAVGECKQLGLQIVYDPIKGVNELNLAHCLLLFPSHIDTKPKKAELRDRFLELCRPIDVRWHHRLMSFLRFRKYHRKPRHQ